MLKLNSKGECQKVLKVGILYCTYLFCPFCRGRRCVNVHCCFHHLHHGLCGSNKLLYKQCAKSMGRPKFRPPLLPHFSTDFNVTWNQERYPRYDLTRKIWLTWDDGKKVCVEKAFSVIFCVLSIYPFLYFCSRLQVTPEDRSRPFVAQNVCFRVR